VQKKPMQQDQEKPLQQQQRTTSQRAKNIRQVGLEANEDSADV